MKSPGTAPNKEIFFISISFIPKLQNYFGKHTIIMLTTVPTTNI